MGEYSDLIMASSPLAYYRMADTNATLADSSGFVRSGAYAGGYTQSQGSLVNSETNAAVLFNGTTGYATFPNSVMTALGTGSRSAISFSLWFKLTALKTLAGTSTILSSTIDGTTEGFGCTYYFNGASAHRFYAFGRPQAADSVALAEYSGTFTAGKNYHLVCVLDFANDLTHLYLDGSIVHSRAQTWTATSFTYGTPGGASYHTLGANRNAAQDFFDGTIDDVAIFGTALSATTVQKHYEVGLGLGPKRRTRTPVRGYYSIHHLGR